MGPGTLQVATDQLGATTSQWEALSSQLVGAPPTPGQPFQATTAAVNAINAAIGVAAAELTTRTQSTAAGVTTAAGDYTTQEATAAGQMSNITGVTVV